MSPSEIFDVIENKDNRYIFIVASILTRTEAERREEKKAKSKIK